MYTANSLPPVALCGSNQSRSEARRVPATVMATRNERHPGNRIARKGAVSSIVPITAPAGMTSRSELSPLKPRSEIMIGVKVETEVRVSV